ncbi:GntR family transcriptional regulator [Salibacterium halotolerans]|uniref:DNA-binding transcriptional regulator, GntR family n=1 Tax=Salibacterium halotolerans TaxID=1884432 RepID=A0A1I5Y3W0_9BACI|nr:GntR family transcriptional regulator [Salibacterium halotolerans]SFQ38911.1 DNA-binding transcriptional regulator, GntR family [Salibacterium halotolerans]
MSSKDQIDSKNSADYLKKDLSEIMHYIEEPRLPQRAYHIIRTAIKNLKLAPGKTFLEREIAEILEMSRTPVREALVRLQTEGIITLVPRRGFIINPIKKDDLKEIYEVTESLDGLAVELATNKITHDELQHLKELIVQQQKCLSENNLYQWSLLDDQFHADIIKYANNNRLNNIIDIHSDQLHRARLYTINDRPVPYRSVTEHQAIITCIEAQNGEAARLAMQSHRKRALWEISEALDNMEL